MSWLYKVHAALAALAVPLPNVSADSDRLQTILNIVFAVTGAMAVLVIILAGVRYIASQGNPSQTSIAKNAIIYALIGLVVIMFAFAIVNFVVVGLT